MVLGTGGHHRRLPGASPSGGRNAALATMADSDRDGNRADRHHHGTAVANLGRVVRIVPRRVVPPSGNGAGSTTAPAQP